MSHNEIATRIWDYARWHCRDLNAAPHRDAVSQMLRPLTDEIIRLKKDIRLLEARLLGAQESLEKAKLQAEKLKNEKIELTNKHTGLQNKLTNLKQRLKRRGINYT